MKFRETIREWKLFCKDCRDHAEPRKNARGRETELAIKAAQEDVCANIDLAITVVLFATGFWKAGILVAIWTIGQFAEATKWEVMLRVERARRDLGGRAR